MPIDDHVLGSLIGGLDRRRTLGDLERLAASIRAHGLLVPVAVTPDMNLVLGLRRVLAIRRIGVEKVPVRYVTTLREGLELLRLENEPADERWPMTSSERVEIGLRLEDLKREPGATVNLIAEALGMSRSRYQRAKALVREAADGDERAMAAVAEMDRTGVVTSVYDAYFGRSPAPTGRSKRSKTESKPKTVTERERESESLPVASDWIPDASERSPQSAQRRRELIAQWAERGYTSAQVGERLHMLPSTVRRIARELEIEFPADRALGRGGVRHVDSNRVLREVMIDLGNVEMSLNLIRFDDLGRGEVVRHVESLGDFIKMMTKFHKRLKEMMSK